MILLLTPKAFATCLDSKEYMQVRNSIIILTKIESFFPRLRKIGASLEKSIATIVETEEREDLKVMALRYS